MTPPAKPGDVVRALAYRFRKAVEDDWDTDRCDVEASAFLAELRQRGWSHNPDADHRAPRPTADPEVKARALAEARAALRQEAPRD
jgi:hypothetical protein